MKLTLTEYCMLPPQIGGSGCVLIQTINNMARVIFVRREHIIYCQQIKLDRIYFPNVLNQ